MSTARSFSAMLNDYLPNKLLKEELLKRTWMLDQVERDDSWEGGTIKVPFRGARPSSIALNKLTASASIVQSQFVSGSISAYQEIWKALKLNFRDLVDHEGKVPEATFLKVLPEELEANMDFFKMALNTLLINGASFAKVTDATNAATGIMVVDKIDKFDIGQAVVLDDDNSSAATYFVTAISVDASSVTLSATSGGAAADVSAYTVAQNAKFYYDGAESASFTSLRSALLSSANGGSSTLHGVTKTLWPFLQAPNVSGSAITASNLLDKLFDAMSTIQQKARGGKITKAVMSFKHLGTILKLIQSEKGAFHVIPNNKAQSTVEYGWNSVMIGSPAGQMIECVGVQEAFDDVIYLLDMGAFTFRSKGFIRKHKSPDGVEYFVERSATDGYTYIVDMCVFGELEVTKPGNCGAIYSISY